jgi:glycerol-3-phosphate dehydrogenase (NAD(P)+)
MRVGVIGGGSFGTAMAQLLAGKGYPVRMWMREPELVRDVNEKHQNTRYMAGFTLAPTLTATTVLEECLQGAELVVHATPSQTAREVMKTAAPFMPPHVPIVTVAKGIENGSLLTMTEVLEEVLPEPLHPYLAVLSGPSFAKEIVQRLPTAVTIAAGWDRVGAAAQKAFSTDFFRAYTVRDTIGVQLGGALKNVIAIAAGCADGLGCGQNTRAAIITRGLAEISRVAVKKGANPLTLSGLAGMGDLVLTCTGELSRNRTVGLALGKGRKLNEIVAEMNQVAEGVKTAISARDLGLKTGVEMPICEQVYAIAHEDKPVKAAVAELMGRDPKAEF